jgi:hypothetical protein
MKTFMCRVIHKSLRDVRPLWYSSRDGHDGGGGGVNRGTDTPQVVWLVVAQGPKPQLHPHNWLTFGKLQDTKRFLTPVHAMFRHDCPLAVKSASTPWRILPPPPPEKKLGLILYLLMSSFLLCLSWLLRCRVRKLRRDLWITLYFCINLKRNAPSRYGSGKTRNKLSTQRCARVTFIATSVFPKIFSS